MARADFNRMARAYDAGRGLTGEASAMTMAIDYDAWALKYDATRGVSPSVLGPLLESLCPPAGRSVLDIGGGTGNYTVALRDAGFRAVHCDPSTGMVRRAASKGLTSVTANSQALPFRDDAFDCAIAVKVLNHVPDRRAFAREARRVTRSGPLILVHATKESIEGNWICHYAPSLRTQERFEPESATVHYLRDAGFADVRVSHIHYSDMADGSAQALKRFPDTFLTGERILNTSLFSRLPEAERDEVLAAIRRDHHSGRLRDVIAKYEPRSARAGDGTIFIARP
jgi:SAM-dependent methyltransferase